MSKKETSLSSVPWPLTLKTKRLVLRPYTASDFLAWREGFRSRKPPQHAFDTAPPLATLTKARFTRMRKRQGEMAKRDMGYVWAVFHRKTGHVVGAVDIYVFNRGDAQSANFGYVIHNQHWGHRYGREAARALALASFRQLRLQRLEATIAPENKASIKLIEALGFRKEGLRKHGDWRGGKWRDVLVYSATPDDFGLPMRTPKIQRKY